jgi:endonuclease/exonuclease/phosphatase (EEP) superfamily protein YafD
LLLAITCLAAALAAQAGRWSFPLDLLAEVAPIWLAGAAAATAAALLLRVRPRGAVFIVGLAGMAAAAALMAPELLRPSPHASAAGAAFRLRVIQINYGGRGVKDPDRVAAWLAVQNPDVIFVDDVDPSIRAAIVSHGFHWRKGTAWTGIASRFPLLSPPFPFSAEDWRTMPDLARARVATPDGPADLIAVHLVRPLPGDSATDTQVASDRLAALAGRYDPSRTVIAGDLNLTPWSFMLRRLDTGLGLTRRDRADFTWPARLFGLAWPAPFMPLDHLYAGPGWKTIDVRVGPPLGATHRPLVVDLAEVP